MKTLLDYPTSSGTVEIINSETSEHPKADYPHSSSEPTKDREITHNQPRNKYIVTGSGRKITNYLYRLPSEIRLHPKEFVKKCLESEDEQAVDLANKWLNGSKMKLKGKTEVIVEPKEPYTLYQLWTYIESLEKSKFGGKR